MGEIMNYSSELFFHCLFHYNLQAEFEILIIIRPRLKKLEAT